MCRFLFACSEVGWLGGLKEAVWSEISTLWYGANGIRRSLPAGSFKCERFVKSSLASSIVGFINGGNDASLPLSRAFRVSLTSFVCSKRQMICLAWPWPLVCFLSWLAPYLSIFELEGEEHLVAIYLLLDDLGSNPALGGIGLPRSCPNIVV